MLKSIVRNLFGRDHTSNNTLIPQHYQRPSLAEHLYQEGPKRILALDGGGIRGALSIAILERIEDLLRARHGNDPAFRLCDYFDLIGGTSTGAIIASALAAKRYSAAEIKDFYFQLGPRVFKGSPFRRGLTRALFDGNRLLKHLRDVFGDMALGDQNIATGLAIVAKRIDTSSTWILNNHPDGLFYNDSSTGSFIGNKHYPLRNIIRASTAAPHYFKPERLEIVAGREYGLFIDGGITPHNNPSFQLLMLAGLRNHSFNWKLNAKDLLMISCGTGSMAEQIPPERFSEKLHVAKTLSALTSVISGSEDFIELLMQWVGDSLDPVQIDSEIGDLKDEYLSSEPLVSYQRYQCILTQKSLLEKFNRKYDDTSIQILRDMANPKALNLAYELGQVIAEHLVKDAHFPIRFDLKGGKRRKINEV